MDTDSFYMAISELTLEDAIRSNMKHEYEKSVYKNCTNEVDFSKIWFPRKCLHSQAI